MICPNCNRIILDNTTVCPNCNAIVSSGTPIINQNSENLDSKGRPKMIFNIIFAVWLIMTYATTGTGAFAILNSENILEFLIMLIPILIKYSPKPPSLMVDVGKWSRLNRKTTI